MTTLEEARVAAQEHGAHVIEHNLDVDLLSQGLLVRASVHGTGIFDRKLQLEELGISSKDSELRRHITAGHKSYAPDYSNRLGTWGTRCRQCVSKYAMQLESVEALTASRSWRFLHFDAYDDFKKAWNELMDLRDAIVEDIAFEHDALVEEAVAFYREQFGESFQRLQERHPGGIAVHIAGHNITFGPDDKDAYVDWVEAHVRADFPTMTAIREDVYAEYFVNFMFDSSSLAEAQAREAEANARTSQANAEAARAEDEQWRLRTTRESRERAIRQAELERMRERVREMADPFAEAMDQLLKELSGHIQALLEGLDKHGSFRGRALDRVDKMMELYRIMGGRNLPDQEIERTLQDLMDRRNTETTDDNREQVTNQIANGLVELRRHVRSESAVIERRLTSHTRAGALEL
jgi:hypothetical protein